MKTNLANITYDVSPQQILDLIVKCRYLSLKTKIGFINTLRNRLNNI